MRRRVDSIAAMGVYDQIKAAFQDIIAPEIHGLRGEMQRLDGRITALDAKIDGIDGRLTAKIDGLDRGLTAKIEALDAKISGLDSKTLSMKAELLAEIRRVDIRIDSVHSRLDSLERIMPMAIDVRERLAALEARRG